MPNFRPTGIEEFKSTISQGKGLANPSLFYVVLPRLRAEGVANPQPLNVLCRSVGLPSRQLSTVQREIGQDTQSIAYGYTNTNVQMRFLVLNNQRTRHYFEAWQNSIVKLKDQSQEGNYAVAFPDEYMHDIKIYQLKKEVGLPIINRSKDVKLGPINVNLEFDIDLTGGGGTTYQWTLYNAYPVMFNQEELTSDAKGQVSEITIEFAYKNWVGTPINKKSGLGIKIDGGFSTDIGSQISNKIYSILN